MTNKSKQEIATTVACYLFMQTNFLKTALPLRCSELSVFRFTLCWQCGKSEYIASLQEADHPMGREVS